MRWLVRGIVGLAIALASIWASAAFWIDWPASALISGGLAVGFPVVTVALFVLLRPLRRATLIWVLLFGAASGWWLSLQPSNERDWEPLVAIPTTATIEGDRVTIHNLRNFDYETENDFTERWETRRYDLSGLEGVDITLCYWGSPWVSHTVMSWEFADSDPLSISIEARRESHEPFSALLGFFRQFELYYVVGDERDVLRLRTNYRGDECYLYRLRAPVETARAVLLDYLRTINELAERPRWYNALVHNCTTMIRYHIQNVAPANPWNWRILVNGKLDELGYMRGSIDTSLPFAELRERSFINERALAADDDPDFWLRIRDGLPGFPDR